MNAEHLHFTLLLIISFRIHCAGVRRQNCELCRRSNTYGRGRKVWFEMLSLILYTNAFILQVYVAFITQSHKAFACITQELMRFTKGIVYRTDPTCAFRKCCKTSIITRAQALCSFSLVPHSS